MEKEIEDRNNLLLKFFDENKKACIRLHYPYSKEYPVNCVHCDISFEKLYEIIKLKMEKDTESLNRMYLVNFGVWKSVIRPRTYDGFWTMKLRDGSVKDLNGVKNKTDAYRYFEDEVNFPDLENLMHLTNAFNTNG